MTGDENPKPRGKFRRSRLLSEEERQLWRKVIADARPLSAGQIIPEPERVAPPSVSREQAIVPKPKPIAGVPRARRNSELLGALPKAEDAAPPLTGLDRRTSQKLARGQIETEARLDLHGMRQAEAEEAFFRFVSRSRREGLRCVLVITGKGESPFARHTLHSARFHEASDHSGVLRSALPQWLGTARFRTEVAGFQPAHPRHGGGGAFYVWLRKSRA
jgi:DNA-nicking Smr family endonuclease